jgi:serine/threonine protein kinase
MDVNSVSSFVEEAETWDKIDDHDHIVGVLDWDSEPVPWIALEYMDGGSLQDRLGELSVAEALWVGVCLCRAVRHAHRRGIAHLDLKPENVLFRETDGNTWDYPKVADWGLAKMLLEHSKSVEGMSPKYAAPEQFDEETYGKPDDFTDIYAVGAVVYAALTGEPPFKGTAASVMQSVLNDEPAPPSERVDGLPEGTDEVVLKALEKRKEDRYESILDLRRKFEELVGEKLRDNENDGTFEHRGSSYDENGKDVKSSEADTARYYPEFVLDRAKEQLRSGNYSDALTNANKAVEAAKEGSEITNIAARADRLNSILVEARQLRKELEEKKGAKTSSETSSRSEAVDSNNPTGGTHSARTGNVPKQDPSQNDTQPRGGGVDTIHNVFVGFVSLVTLGVILYIIITIIQAVFGINVPYVPPSP